MPSNALVPLHNGAGERAQLIRVLQTMGVGLPPSTKLPASALHQRITKALDLSQMLTDIFGAGRGPNVERLKPWERNESLYQGMSHCTPEDTARWEKHIETFDVVRCMIGGIANDYECGVNSYFGFAEDEGNRIIRLKVTGAYKAAEEHHLVVPVLAVDCSFKNIRDDDGKGLKIILASDVHTLFRILLETNAARIKKGSQEVSTSGVFRSCLLPFNTLCNKEIGSVGKDIGCPVCGNPTKSRCARCQSISYCGAVCQRSHWKQHKSTCLPLSEGTWVRMKYTNCHPYSFRDMLALRKPACWDAEPTVHGKEPFIVRVKVTLFPDDKAELVVRDRRESFSGIFLSNENKLNNVRLGSLLGDHSNTVYLLATYLGNSILRLRIDPIPDQSLFVW